MYDDQIKLEYIMEQINKLRKSYVGYEISKLGTDIEKLYREADFLVFKIKRHRTQKILTERVDNKCMKIMEE